MWIILLAAVMMACNPFPRESVRMNAALEQAEVVYGAAGLEVDIDTVLFIPDLAEAADYFAGKKQYGKAALAALYNGYSEKDFNKEAAMLSFKEAERCGKLAHDSLTVVRAEYWMGKLLYNEGKKEEALSVFKASFDHIGNRTMDRAAVENGLAVTYLLMHRFDSAEIQLQNGLNDARIGGSEKMERKILNNFAVLYRIQGEFDQALNCTRGTLAKSHLDTTERALAYLNLGNVFVLTGSVDSAAFYYQCLEKLVSAAPIKDNVKLTVYDALLNFAKKQHNDSLALLYYDKHENALYGLLSQRQEQTVYRIQKQYDYEVLKSAVDQERTRYQRIVALVAVLLLGVLAWMLFRSAKASKREARANANLFHFMQQNKALVESNMAQEEKTVRVEQQLSNRLFARLSAMQKLDYCLKNPKDRIALKDLERDVFGSGDHWEAVKEVLVNLYPGLWESLRLKYPEMDEMELRVCMLSRLKLSRSGEATLLGVSTSVLDKLRTRVRRTMEQDKNP